MVGDASGPERFHHEDGPRTPALDITLTLKSHLPGHVFLTHTELAADLQASSDLALDRALLQGLLAFTTVLPTPGAVAVGFIGGETAAVPESQQRRPPVPRSLLAELRVASRLTCHSPAAGYLPGPSTRPHSGGQSVWLL